MIRTSRPRRVPGIAVAVATGAFALAACSSGGAAPGASTPPTWSVARPSATPPGARSDQPSVQPSVQASDQASSAAALPPQQRVRQVPRGTGGPTRVTPPGDGVWMISRPEGAAPGFAEVLHLDGAGRVLRAWPFPGLAPQWLLVTSRAVYCGRHGDATAPDAMVCRIDRGTGDLRVHVFADRTGATAVGDDGAAGRPGTWVVEDLHTPADLGVAPQVGAEVTFRSGGLLRLDADTLGALGS